MAKKTNECTGDCCASFTLATGSKARLSRSKEPEFRQIGDMIIRLGPDKVYAGHDNFTCTHYDPVTKLCSDYENRPMMCRQFPYAGKCGVCGMVGPDCKDPTTAKEVWCCSTHEHETLEKRKVSTT